MSNVLNIDGVKIEHLGHAGFKITDGDTIYIDPFNVNTDEKADIILITHEHYDHCSIKDIQKLVKQDTTIVTVADCQSKLSTVVSGIKGVKIVRPGAKLTIGNVSIETVPAYNVNKFRAPGLPFHQNQNEWVGFIVTIKGKRIYHAGDTDLIPEMKNITNIDVALLPVSGTYVMTAEEAAKAAEIINPKIAVPMHYGAIVGSANDAEKFRQLYKGDVRIL
ncbi:MAG: MBL fold metallo-hydrolase [Candidatus Woesearchaeota archaeon]|nr:MBL fold metallo-hydrolase [Candidatus Woesearchaeota archaeon]